MKLLPIAMVLVGICSCTVTTSATHTYVHDFPESVAAGACMAIEGPVSLPSGATSDYVITDDTGLDSMDVTIVEDSLGCDFADGAATNYSISDVSDGTGSLPSGSYVLLVQCNNAAADCTFSATWTATY